MLSDVSISRNVVVDRPKPGRVTVADTRSCVLCAASGEMIAPKQAIMIWESAVRARKTHNAVNILSVPPLTFRSLFSVD